ncbi:MAG TPA: hypothetical protein VFG67_00355 [Oleiagrimonas sp.]|nr:hypothetical protein [Oleiagrimonas sp.]
MRYAAIVLSATLLLPVAAMAGAPQSSDAHASLKQQVAQVHREVRNQKQETDRLREKVDALQKQTNAGRERLKQSDETIAKLRKQLEKLDVKAPTPSKTH